MCNILAGNAEDEDIVWTRLEKEWRNNLAYGG